MAVRDTLKVDRDALHKDYLLGYTSGISGNYTVEGDDTTKHRYPCDRTCCRTTTDLLAFRLRAGTPRNRRVQGSDGHAYPMVVTFLRHQDQSKTGRTYNRFSIKVTDSAGKNDSLVVPPVPEDQFQD